MRRAALLLACGIAIPIFPAFPATANGGAVLDFGDPYLEVGSEAMGSTVVALTGKDPRALERGPFYAYLLPEGRWIRPPRIPIDAIRVGTLDFRWLTDRKVAATLSFTVPDVPSRRYGLHYCNDPCTTAAVGDLYAGSVLVARDAEVGALLLENERFQARASSAQWRFKRAQRQIAKLEAAAAATGGPDDPMVGEVEAQPVEARRSPADAGGGRLPWVVGLGALGAGFLLGRVRRRAQPAAASPGRERPVRELEPV